MKRFKMIFKGRVQAVGFRYKAMILARKYLLTGSVKNLYNGDVEVYIQGQRQNIEFFINSLDNDRFIRIDRIEKEALEVIEGEKDFIVKN